MNEVNSNILKKYFTNHISTIFVICKTYEEAQALSTFLEKPLDNTFDYFKDNQNKIFAIFPFYDKDYILSRVYSSSYKIYHSINFTEIIELNEPMEIEDLINFLKF